MQEGIVRADQVVETFDLHDDWGGPTLAHNQIMIRTCQNYDLNFSGSVDGDDAGMRIAYGYQNNGFPPDGWIDADINGDGLADGNDIGLLIEGKKAPQYASEGQQRTVALALKIAQAQLFALEEQTPPLLLIDDVFGELDPIRRNALLEHLPGDAQKLVTATSMQWQERGAAGPVYELRERQLFPR